MTRLAFYDALETNDSAVQVLGDETLRAIARELVETVRSNVTIDWTLRENVRAQLRVLVRRILRKHGYPPDKQERATLTVLEQAEALSEGWVTLDPAFSPVVWLNACHLRYCLPSSLAPNPSRKHWRRPVKTVPI